MEENKEEIKEENKQKEFTPEQYEAYAAQVVARAKQVMKENNALKAQIDTLVMQLNSKDIDWAFKVVELRDVFSKPFVDKVVAKLEEVLMPTEVEETPEKGE